MKAVTESRNFLTWAFVMSVLPCFCMVFHKLLPFPKAPAEPAFVYTPKRYSCNSSALVCFVDFLCLGLDHRLLGGFLRRFLFLSNVLLTGAIVSCIHEVQMM